eukprot:TRINITY_DN6886_c0_g1_i2.p1 TRINITY_DN6886_c0_g1~~TRINITY_DN6886_c0_g1_i2.p1  ORF type:complete len:266 (-),score=43.72 TRINITY_DN6886_c0_g1_i2:49-846(-)
MQNCGTTTLEGLLPRPNRHRNDPSQSIASGKVQPEFCTMHKQKNREEGRLQYRLRVAQRHVLGHKIDVNSKRYFERFTPSDAPVVLAVRELKKHAIPQQAVEILDYFGLTEPFIGRLLVNNEETKGRLYAVSDFVRVAYPSEADLRQLLHTRCNFLDPNGMSVHPVNGNAIIEALLGPFNIICVEDIVHELITGGSRATLICKMLAPLILNQAEGKKRRKVRRKLLDMPHVQEIMGGDAALGFAGSLIQKMGGAPKAKVVRVRGH